MEYYFTLSASAKSGEADVVDVIKITFMGIDRVWYNQLLEFTSA
jgi:hypothetical protein